MQFKRYFPLALAVLIGGEIAAQEAQDLAGLSNIQENQTSGISSLAGLRLSLASDIDGVSALKMLCGSGIDFRSQTPGLFLAAIGYDQTAVPYSAVERPGEFCRCSIQIAAYANRIAASLLKVEGMDRLPDPGDLATPKLLPSKNGNGVTSCRAGGWRVDFTPAGLVLQRNGVPILGGEKQLVAGKSLETGRTSSQSWAE